MVTRYNLAYINPLVFGGDNGRVLGYDNAHGEHHRHYMGKAEAVEIGSYEEALNRFQAEWQELARTLSRPKGGAGEGVLDHTSSPSATEPVMRAQ